LQKRKYRARRVGATAKRGKIGLKKVKDVTTETRNEQKGIQKTAQRSEIWRRDVIFGRKNP
jgi:hypothetical protein